MASALILAAAVLFGVSPIIAKVAYAYGVTPLTLVSLRATIGGLAVWLGVAVTRRITPLPWTLFVRLLALGLTIVPFQVFTYFYALSQLPASSASVIANSAPVHVAWMGRLFLGESLQAADVAILVGIIGGAGLVAGQTPYTGQPLGLAALAIATLASAFYLVAQRRLVRDVAPLAVLSVILPASAAVYWGAGVATGQIHLAMPAAAWLATVGGAIAGSLGSLLVLIALQVTPATRAAMLGMFEPVVTVALSVVLLGDLMTWLRGLGIAVVLGGIALIHLRRFA
ncbi:MAG: DMT family transporter [Bacillati bacterium ANGP1]|uniref:DMT family transporter n=1 Tax=Candidatus Segetimicrobium genomatis TaxID=2569760 RepID=A0A537J449_9BACT|nr:MAG: DMT family transporter [Terrabacteria group bacterium ANGP1]